jgi:hypothetical protein
LTDDPDGEEAKELRQLFAREKQKREKLEREKGIRAYAPKL